MLYKFTEPDAPCVGADRDAEFGGHQLHREHLIHAGEAAGVQLAVVDGLGLEELLEEDAVHAVLAGGYADGLDCPADLGVPEDVVGACWFLDPKGVEFRQLFHPVDRRGNVPHLVGVDHEVALRPDHIAGDAKSADVVLQGGPDFQLDMAVALVHSLLAQAAQLFVGVAQPSRGGGVAGIAFTHHLFEAVVPCGVEAGKDSEGLIPRQRIRQIRQVRGVDDLLRGHVHEQPPQRLSGTPRGQVPHRVHYRSKCKVFHTFVRSEPPQL
ncbi:hypothetical protein D9M72_526680 [compost metagenome]